MAIDRELASLLGVSEDAPEAEVNRRRQELAEFYESADVPPALHEWARLQALKLVAQQAAPTAPRSRANLLDKLLTSWIVLGSLVLAAVVGGVLLAKLDPFAAKEPAPRAAEAPVVPVPLDERRLAELSRIAEQDPGAEDALRELGQSYFVAGQWQQAINWLTRLVAIDGTDVRAITDIGTASFNLGNRKDARNLWLAALALAPGDPLVHYSLGYLYVTDAPPNTAAARKEWQTVVELAPNSNLAAAAQTRLAATTP